MIKACEICGKAFVAQRRTARFCSGTCRQRHNRGVAPFQGSLQAPTVQRPTVDPEELVSRGHSIASDFSRAALQAPAPLCHALGRIGEGIEAALRGEGL